MGPCSTLHLSELCMPPPPTITGGGAPLTIFWPILSKVPPRSSRQLRGQPGPGAGRDAHTIAPPRANVPAARLHRPCASFSNAPHTRHAHAAPRAQQMMNSNTAHGRVAIHRMPLIGERGPPVKPPAFPALRLPPPCAPLAHRWGWGLAGGGVCGGWRTGGNVPEAPSPGRARSILPPLRPGCLGEYAAFPRGR